MSTALHQVRSIPPLPEEKRDSLVVVSWAVGVIAPATVYRGAFELPHGAGRLVGYRLHFSGVGGGTALTGHLGVFLENPAGTTPISAPTAANLLATVWTKTTAFSGVGTTSQVLADADDVGEVYGYSRGDSPSELGRLYGVVESVAGSGSATLLVELLFLPLNRLDQVPASSVEAPEAPE